MRSINKNVVYPICNGDAFIWREIIRVDGLKNYPMRATMLSCKKNLVFDSRSLIRYVFSIFASIPDINWMWKLEWKRRKRAEFCMNRKIVITFHHSNILSMRQFFHVVSRKSNSSCVDLLSLFINLIKLQSFGLKTLWCTTMILIYCKNKMNEWIIQSIDPFCVSFWFPWQKKCSFFAVIESNDFYYEIWHSKPWRK